MRAGAIGAHHVELLRAVPVRFEDDAAPVGAVAGPGIDGVGVGEAPWLPVAQVHFDDGGGARFADAHDDALSVRREAWRKCHTWKIPDELELSSLEVHEEHPRLVTG